MTTSANVDDDETPEEVRLRQEERIAMLLARAEDFRRHGEDGSADAALELAERIMLKYAIDAATIAARQTDGSTEEIVTATIPFGGIYRKALALRMSALIRENGFAVRPFLSAQGNVDNVVIVGFKSEVDQLKLLVTSLNLQAISGLATWWQNHPGRASLRGMDGYKERRQFVSSFIDGASDRIGMSRTEVLREAGTGVELIIRDRKQNVDDYVSANYKLSPVRTRLSSGSAAAGRAGYRAGQQANVGETPVASGRREITS